IAGAVAMLAILELAVSFWVARRGRARAMGIPNVVSPPRVVPGGASPAGGRIWLASALLVLEGLAVESIPIANWPAVSTRINIESLPERIAGRTAHVIPGDDAFLGSVWFAHRIHRSYAAEDDVFGPVRVFVGLEDTATLRSGYAPKTVLPGSGWVSFARAPDAVVRERDAGTLDPWEPWIVAYPDRHTRVLHGRFGYAPWGLEVFGRWLGLDRAGVLGERRAALVIRLELDDRGDRPERRWMILRQVAQGIESWYAQTPK
ncbi:hypothetical protein K2X89_13935, partial [Myxococcota bacterium]|nr:hypothetical protein [Myxococcota bacterium]